MNATVVGYGYPAGTELTWTAATPTFDKSLNISGLVKVDVSGATLIASQPCVIAYAESIVGYTKESLGGVEVTFPQGVDASGWKLKVMTVAGRRALCIAPAVTPFRVILL